MKDEYRNNAEMSESVGAIPNEGHYAPDKTDKTAIPQGPAKEDEHSARIIPPRKWPPKRLIPYPQICEMLRLLTGRFFPKDHLVEILMHHLRHFHDLSVSEAAELSADAYDLAIEYWVSQADDLQWGLRLKEIFDGQYPTKAQEYWFLGGVAERKYQNMSADMDMPFTYEVDQFDRIGNLGRLLIPKLAPDLCIIEKTKNGYRIDATADVERFLNAEKKTVPRCNLFEVVVQSRPIWRAETGWSNFNLKRLPRRSYAAKLICKSASPDLLLQFVDDLKVTFAWPSDGSLGVFLGYLLQPMVCHLRVGQMPAYCFLGPTKAGKGYLSNTLPAILYNRPGGPTVMVKQITASNYELEVLLNSCKDRLYICFDEVKNASDNEMKMIDAFCTQPTVQVRKFQVGYIEIENDFTLSMTAVNRTFTDESYGRIAVVKLKESRPDKISAFHYRWCKAGPELLRAMFDSINAIELDGIDLPIIPDRRPGFGLMAHLVKNVFYLDPDYKVDSSNSDTLDDLCRMHEEKPGSGRIAGAWRQYSLRSFTDYMTENHEIKWKRANALAAINTALGYTSTRNHPSYKLTGYPSESGKHYHIELREEGQKSVRTFVYIKDVFTESQI
jgi:hypothetical protein